MALAWKIVSYEMMVLFRKKSSYWGVMMSVMYSHQETQMGSCTGSVIYVLCSLESP